MTRVIHIDDLSHPVDKSPLFACEYLSLILLVTMLHPNIHNKDTHYSLSRRSLFIIKTSIIDYTRSLPHLYHTHKKQGTSPNLSLAINYHPKIKRFLLSHLTFLFSRHSTFRERRFIIHFKYFLQIYPPKIWWIQSGQLISITPLIHISAIFIW